MWEPQPIKGYSMVVPFPGDWSTLEVQYVLPDAPPNPLVRRYGLLVRRRPDKPGFKGYTDHTVHWEDLARCVRRGVSALRIPARWYIDPKTVVRRDDSAKQAGYDPDKVRIVLCLERDKPDF